MVKVSILSFICLLAVGCSNASAAQVDPDNDIHCATLAVALRLISTQEKHVPEDQRRAVEFLDDWYGTKVRKLVLAQGEGKVLAEAEAVSKIVETSLPSLRSEIETCTERAISDAGLSR